MTHGKSKKVIELSLLIVITLLTVSTVTALVISQTVSDTFTGGLRESVAANLGLSYTVTDKFIGGLSEFLFLFPNLVLTSNFHFSETLKLVAGILALVNDGFHMFDSTCSLCTVVVNIVVTISQTSNTSTLQATDSPLNQVITEIILPLAIVFTVMGLVAIKFPLAGLSLMITVGIMTFIYLVYLNLFPSWILVIVAIVGAACFAILITSILGKEQHG